MLGSTRFKKKEKEEEEEEEEEEKEERNGRAWFSTWWRMSEDVWYFQHSFPYPDGKWSRLGWPSGRRCLTDGDPMSVSPIEVVSYLATLKPASDVKLPFAFLTSSSSFLLLPLINAGISVAKTYLANKSRILNFTHMIGNELRPLGNLSFLGPLAGNSRIVEPYSDLSKLFRRRCRI